MKTIRPLIVAAAALLFAGHTLAQTATPTLRIATGKAGKGFSRVYADIQAVCGHKVNLTEVETEGGLQNLTVLAANKADLGFVQVDTLQAFNSSDPSIAALQAVMSMNSNLLHVVARASGFVRPPSGVWEKVGVALRDRNVVIEHTADLKGLPVAVVGSARALGRELNRIHGLNLQFTDVTTDEEGLKKVRAGEVAALFSTSGWPSGPIQALKRNDGVRLVRFDLPTQEPYQLVHRNYDNLDAYRHPFLSVPNALMTRPFTAGGAYGKAVTMLRACIQANLTTLREGPYEPMWQEVRSDAPSFGLTRFGPAAGAKP